MTQDRYPDFLPRCEKCQKVVPPFVHSWKPDMCGCLGIYMTKNGPEIREDL